MGIEDGPPRLVVRSPAETAAIVLETTFGWVGAVAQAERLVAVSLPMRTRLAAVAACGLERHSSRPHAMLDSLAADLRRYFSGERVDLGRYPVDISRRSTFHRRALLAARGIPYGRVQTYGWVAHRAGRPRGARAAGQAMSRNPIALVIPCHRVIAASGRLGGFGGGREMKRALLELEGIACDSRGLETELCR